MLLRVDDADERPLTEIEEDELTSASARPEVRVLLIEDQDSIAVPLVGGPCRRPRETLVTPSSG
jgi:hypothetical protein